MADESKRWLKSCDLERLEDEIGAMRQDPGRLPWQAGLPDAVFCSASAGIALDRSSRLALGIALI